MKSSMLSPLPPLPTGSYPPVFLSLRRPDLPGPCLTYLHHRKSRMKSRFLPAPLFLLALILFSGCVFRCGTVFAQSALNQHWGQFFLSFRLDPTKGVKENGVVLFSVPQNLPPYQSVKWKILEASVPFKTRNSNGDTVLTLAANTGTSFTLEVEADVRPYDIRPQLSALEKKATLPPFPAEVADFLKPSPDIDCNAPEFARIVKPLKHPNPVKTVRQILDWLSRNITYHQEWPELPISRQFAKRRGECVAWSYFFVGLCQSAGIPARWAWGMVGHNGDLPEQGTLVGHGWAEVYVPSIGWVPLEPQLPDSFGNTGAFNIAPYIAFAHSHHAYTSFSPTRGYPLHPSASLIMMGGNEATYRIKKRDPLKTPLR